MDLTDYQSGLIILLTVVAVTWYLRVRGSSSRGGADDEHSRHLAVSKWARGVEFSIQQLSAMRSLWRWYITGKKPGADPLSNLSPGDLADLLTKSNLEYLPHKLRRADEELRRQELLQALRKQGFEEMHSEIIVGMKYSRLGPANDL